MESLNNCLVIIYLESRFRSLMEMVGLEMTQNINKEVIKSSKFIYRVPGNLLNVYSTIHKSSHLSTLFIIKPFF